jgi:hypothetical protein
MKKFYKILIISFILLGSINAQDIIVTPIETVLSDSVGATLTFHIDITNNLSEEVTVAVVRTQNDLPPDWTSSICMADACYPSTLDSVLTNIEFGSTPLAVAETRELKMIVQSSLTTPGVANMQVRVFNFRNPAEFVLIDLEASTMVTALGDLDNGINSYSLNQNYPNPFNPSTNISFNLAEAGNVIITVFDLLGRVVAEPINEYKSAGLHSFNFNGAELSSGTYFYTVESNSFYETKKMILEK